MSQPEINRELIERIAGLAALELTEEEKSLFLVQFQEILHSVEQIKTASLNTTLPKTTPKPAHLRNDQPHPQKSPPELPYLEDGLFKVPKVIG